MATSVRRWCAKPLNIWASPWKRSKRSIDRSGPELNEEWQRLVADSSDPGQVVRFYNESRAELFEQIAWHSTEPIHHRSLICADMAATLPGRDFLDFGSGIGSNALVFGLQGFRVTLADVADPLRNFASGDVSGGEYPPRRSTSKRTAAAPMLRCHHVLRRSRARSRPAAGGEEHA